MRQSTYHYASCLLNSAVFRCLLNVSFSSTVLMLPGTLFQVRAPWYADPRCSYDLVLVVAMPRIFGSDDERSGLAGVYTFNSCGIESQSCKQFYWVLVANVTFSEEA